MNANGMIDSAADYAFVDFANGDLPSANIDGHPMPLRSGDAMGILSAEDVAFLHECIADKTGAFNGLSSGTTELVPGTNARRVLTRKIEGAQMERTRSYLATALAKGIPTYGLGFLSADLPSGVRFLEPEYYDDFDSHLSTALAGLDQDYGLHAATTAQSSDFARGAPVARQPVESLFLDAAKLIRPCFVFGYHPYVTSIFTQTGGGYHVDPVPQFGDIGWEMVNMADSEYEGYVEWEPNQLLMSVPGTFIKNPRAWLVFCAYESTQLFHPPSGRPLNTVRRRTGIIEMSSVSRVFQVLPDGAGNYVLNAALGPLGSRLLISTIASALGWPIHHAGEDPDAADSVRTQWLYVDYDSAIILAADPIGRTKWWTN